MNSFADSVFICVWSGLMLSVGALLGEIVFYVRNFRSTGQGRIKSILIPALKTVAVLFVYVVTAGAFSFFYLSPEYRGSLMLLGVMVVILMIVFFLEKHRSQIVKAKEVLEENFHKTIDELKEFTLEDAAQEMERARKSKENVVPRQVLKNLHLKPR